jgi:hypothetical protein
VRRRDERRVGKKAVPRISDATSAVQPGVECRLVAEIRGSIIMFLD